MCILKERLILISESINNITHAQIALYNTSFVFISVRLSTADLITGREKTFVNSISAAQLSRGMIKYRHIEELFNQLK